MMLHNCSAATRVRNFVLVIACGLSGCDKDQSIPADMYVMHIGTSPPVFKAMKFTDPWDLPHSGFQKCLHASKGDLAPEVFERSSFASRVDRGRGVVARPLDFRCLSTTYDRTSAHVWAARGDPVAVYLDDVYKYPTITAICQNISQILPQLLTAYDVKSNIVISNRELSRVPELYYLAMYFRHVCLYRKDYDAYDDALRHGYDLGPNKMNMWVGDE